MKVSVGWSGEQRNGSWRRVDIELDETDLKRLFTEMGLPPGLVTEARTTEVFGMLEAEVQRLLTAELVMRYPGAAGETAKDDLAKYMQQRHDAAEKIRKRANPGES